MKKGLKLALIIAVTLVLLAVLKPSKENFNGYVKETYEKIDTDDTIENMAKSAIRNAGKAALNMQGQLTTNYNDRIFFATGSAMKMDKTIEYLGIFGFWIKISE